jgi:predicted nucleic acid-binding protein
MATRVADAPSEARDFFLDTNILLTASSPQREYHQMVLTRIFSELPAQGVRLAVSHQILREYLVVATRPDSVNGLGLGLEQALSNCEQFRKRVVVVDDGDDPGNRLAAVLKQIPCVGKQIHDAAVVVSMLANRMRRLVTLDSAHFKRFSPLIEVFGPGDL